MAVVQLLAEAQLEDARRLGAIHLLARLSLKENPGWNPQDLVKAEPANDRAVALRLVALYDTGDYRGCAKAIVEARAAGHLLWPMALKYPRLRKMLDDPYLTTCIHSSGSYRRSKELTVDYLRTGESEQ